MSGKKPTVETFAAGEFICEVCGRNSYFSLINVENELSTEELEDFYRKVLGKKPMPGTKSFWMQHPLTVVCQHCQTEHNTFGQIMQEGVTDDAL